MLCRTIFQRFSHQPVRLLQKQANIEHDGQQAALPETGKFEEEFVRNHIDITPFQRALLTVGSAAITILDPYRADMLSCLGETTGNEAAKEILRKMEESEEGSLILRDQPRINSNTVDLEKLKNYPEGTLGKTYSNFLESNKVTPDSRLPVRFMDDMKLAYVIQRYREIHDLTHAILGMPTHMLGEVTVKWVEAIQTKLPMCIAGAIMGPIRLKPRHRHLYRQYHLPWAIKTGFNSEFIMNVYFEKRWDQPLNEFHEEMNISLLTLPEKK